MRQGKPIILASSSPYRAQLLRRAGLPFEVVRPAGDESVPAGLPPEKAVVEIALKKMEDVAGRVRGGIIIASDQVMALGRERVGKPGTAKKAVDLLLRLRGREHRLLTSLVVCDHPRGRVLRHLDIHRVTLRRFTRREAERYVRLDRPLDCAGAIRIESGGCLLVERAVGEDFTAIIGLPMMALAGMLRKLGVGLFPGLPGTREAMGRPWRLEPRAFALIVVDMQRYFTGDAAGLAAPVLGNVNRLIAWARERGVPVFFTRHGHADPRRDGGMLRRWWGDLIVRGTPDHELDPALDVRPGDIVVDKTRYSAFAGTSLDRILRGRGIRQLVVAGTMTNLCCETTAREAFVRDYEVLFVSDATATASDEMQQASLLNLAYGFAHVVATDDVVRCGRAPGRRR
jgi:MAF protein